MTDRAEHIARKILACNKTSMMIDSMEMYVLKAPTLLILRSLVGSGSALICCAGKSDVQLHFQTYIDSSLTLDQKKKEVGGRIEAASSPRHIGRGLIS
jgi:hypothetical protein